MNAGAILPLALMMATGPHVRCVGPHDLLLASAPVAGLGRVAAAAPDVATALRYDIAVHAGGTDDR